MKVHQPGSGSETMTRFFYETVDGVTRVYAALAPVAANVSCINGAGEPQFSPGCRSLWFYYADTTTATGSGNNQNTWGDYAGRLREITFFAHDGSDWTEPSVARYDYDSLGRLRAAWDPRISPALKTTYKYESDGRLKEVKPPGENAWTLTYKPPSSSDENNPGRLASASRAVPGGGTATTTVNYDIPLSGSGSPYDMSAGRVDDWGQTDVPTDATSIDPPTSLPANVHYMNRNGDLVNLASPGGEISTMEYESHRMVRRELTPGNRARALASSDPSATSRLLDIQRTYSPDGLELLEELGPQHEVQLSDGQLVEAREHTVTAYDEGALASQDYHLPTTQSVGARVAGQSADLEVRTTKTEYDWKLRKPTVVRVDPGGLNLVTKTTYDADTGLPIETRLPKGANGDGTDAHTTKTIYWTAGGEGECAGRPDWANLPCKETPGGQPTTGSAPPLPTTFFYYNVWNQVASTYEDVDGAPDRVTTKTYDPAGRVTHTAISGGQGTHVPAVTTAYSSATGRITSISSGGDTISRGYDTIGRQTSYTDADGVTSTTSYDELNRPVQTYDGKGTTAVSYDPTTGRPTGMTDSGAGSFGAAYDADGKVVAETFPNQTQLLTAYNSAGETTSRAYTRTFLGNQLPLMGFAASYSVHGQVESESTTTAGALSSTQSYDYDTAGRLAKTWDTRAGVGCTGREYSYDPNSNRTALRTIAPGAGGACDTNPGAGQHTNHSYDEADRAIDSGYTYDRYGRTLSVPAADAGGSQLQSTFYRNDRVRTLTQAGVTRTFEMDPANRVRVRATNGESDEVYHYADDTDSPAWIANQNANADWERYVGSIGGGLSAIQRGHGSTSDSVAYALTNIHGDVAGETDATGILTASTEADEFGVPQGAIPESGYGWLGGKERRSQFASGVITMGARVYVPQTGRFLQTDVVAGPIITPLGRLKSHPP